MKLTESLIQKPGALPLPEDRQLELLLLGLVLTVLALLGWIFLEILQARRRQRTGAGRAARRERRRRIQRELDEARQARPAPAAEREPGRWLVLRTTRQPDRAGNPAPPAP